MSCLTDILTISIRVRARSVETLDSTGCTEAVLGNMCVKCVDCQIFRPLRRDEQKIIKTEAETPLSCLNPSYYYIQFKTIVFSPVKVWNAFLAQWNDDFASWCKCYNFRKKISKVRVVVSMLCLCSLHCMCVVYR